MTKPRSATARARSTAARALEAVEDVEETQPQAPQGGEGFPVDQLPIGRLFPYLSERGRIELDLAVQRFVNVEAAQVIKEKEDRIAELEALVAAGAVNE